MIDETAAAAMTTDGQAEFPAADAAEESTSALLRRFRDHLPAGSVSLGDLLAALGDRSLGTVLLALSLPTISPVPLGISVLFNLPLLLFAIGLAIKGVAGAAPPRWLLRGSVDSAAARRLLDVATPKVAKVERLLQPRLPQLAHIDARPGFTLWVLLLAIVAFVPVPLMGWLPGFSLVILSLGLIERDGAAIGVSLALGVAALIVGAFLVGGLSYAGQELLTP